jgi:hypothetical protein
MKRSIRAVSGALLCLGLIGLQGSAQAEETLTEEQKVACARKLNIDVNGRDRKDWHEPAAGRCKMQTRGGRNFPDPACTPGALNPTVTVDVLRSPDFVTACVRDQAEDDDAKSIVFKWYGTPDDGTCEKDHFVPLEIGGSDRLENIWPQCGPRGAKGEARYFKQKDGVELYLGRQVRAGVEKGGMTQEDARQRITKDWAALLDDARKDEAAQKSKGKAK